MSKVKPDPLYYSSAAHASVGEYRNSRLAMLPRFEDTETPPITIPAPYSARPPLTPINPLPRNMSLKFNKSRIPQKAPPTAQQIADNTPILINEDEKRLADENKLIFTELIDQLIDSMEDAVNQAVCRGIIPTQPKANDSDAYRLLETMKVLATRNVFANPNSQKITESVFQAWMAASNPEYEDLLKYANNYLCGLIWLCGPDMINCPAVQAQAQEYLDESGEALIPDYLL